MCNEENHTYTREWNKYFFTFLWKEYKRKRTSAAHASVIRIRCLWHTRKSLPVEYSIVRHMNHDAVPGKVLFLQPLLIIPNSNEFVAWRSKPVYVYNVYTVPLIFDFQDSQWRNSPFHPSFTRIIWCGSFRVICVTYWNTIMRSTWILYWVLKIYLKQCVCIRANKKPKHHHHGFFLDIFPPLS